MDLKKHSQKRSRLNKTSEIIDSSSWDNNYYSENNNLKSSKSASESGKYSKPRYFNSSNQSVSRSHQTVNDDSDNEENFNKIPNNEQYNRRDSSSSEETDENNSDDDNHKRKIKQSGKVLSKQEKRRKKTSQRRLHNQREEKRISSSRNDNEEDVDEDRASLKLHRTVQMARKNSKRLKTKSRNGKEGGKKEGRGDTKDNEVPITEILRQAEENPRRQYEEPKPLTQLSTDTIYVQGVNRFSAVKIPEERITRGRRGPDTGETAMYPIKIAILAQKAWKNAGFIYQGLLAGMAFIHFILIQTYFKPLKKPIEDYSIIAEIYANLFSFFIVMCIISAFDRFDLAHFDIEHFRGLYNNYAKAMTVIPLYIAVFCLHQATLSVNDKLILLNYTKNATSYMNENTTTATTISDEELENWKAITLTKDGIVVVAWLLVSFGPPSDMLLTHLKSLEKYHNSDYY
ncbi:uncharacterized protein LOC141534304 [Cotesia typhae]|uniref:uncharacterized protein LOC141534304 n=1 Tax=Cotesia typhae TaxID=2053667 RepID=UPI003D681156